MPKQSAKPRATKYDDKLKVNITFEQLIQKAGEDAKRKNAPASKSDDTSNNEQ